MSDLTHDYVHGLLTDLSFAAHNAVIGLPEADRDEAIASLDQAEERVCERIAAVIAVLADRQEAQ